MGDDEQLEVGYGGGVGEGVAGASAGGVQEQYGANDGANGEVEWGSGWCSR